MRLRRILPILASVAFATAQAVDTNTITIASAHNGAAPAVGDHAYTNGTPLTCGVTNSPVLNGATQYVCTAASVTSNDFTQITPTNVALTLTNNATLTWQWATNYWLAVTAAGDGGVDVASGWFAAGSNVTVTATPDANRHFAGWSGDTNGCALAGAAITAPMDQARALVANFAIDTYAVAFNLGDHGTRTGGGELTQTVAHGGAATAPEVQPEAGWIFEGWDVAFGDVTAPLTVQAQYGRILHTLAVASEHGVTDPAVGIHTNAWGSELNATVTSPDTRDTTQYVCTGWVGTGSVPPDGETASVSFTITNNSGIVWNWSTNYWLAVETAGSGGVDVASGWFAAGSNVNVTATPATGWHFVGWNGDTNGCDVEGVTLTAPMDRARTVEARFEIDRHTLEVVSAHGGNIPGTLEAAYGTELSLSSPNSPIIDGTTQHICIGAVVSGNAFTQPTPTSVLLTLTNNATLTWLWETRYLLAAYANEGGSVSGTGWYAADVVVTLTAIPAQHFQFVQWSDGVLSASRFVTVPAGGISFVALFAPMPGGNWDTGYQFIGNGWRRLDWFGDYVPMGEEGWIWHNQHGFFFVPQDALPENIWLYAPDMGWLWTSSEVYPFFYRHADNAWLWYNGGTNPRWFVNMATAEWENWP